MTALDALGPTWPPLRTWSSGPFLMRDGAGGGKRVSAASFIGSDVPEISALMDAEAEMHGCAQAPLFALTPDQQAFDELLAQRGYTLLDPTRLYTTPVGTLTNVTVPRVTVFEIWEPLAIMADIWAAGGIGPARLDVMVRASGPKTGLFGRIDNRPAAAGFVAAHGGFAMLHALEVLEAHRRKGLARWMIHAAAHWAVRQGCETLALLVTEANLPANALYHSMGFTSAPGYHYRMQKEPSDV